MAGWNGSGTFTRTHNWTDDKNNGIKITSSRHDTNDTDFVNGINNCLTKDGQNSPSANIPFNGRKITGYGSTSAPNARTDVPSYGQVADGKTNWVDGGGSADGITAAYTPAVTSADVTDGRIFYVRATAANTSTTPTFKPDSATARTIVKMGGQALVAGDVAGDGHELALRYDLANTRYELLNPAQSAASTIPYTAANASAAASLDFAEDTDNGTNVATLIGPASIASDVTITLPSATGTLATLAGTETLTNKTLTDSSVTFADDGDGTKKLAFQCSGITTGTTRTVTIPDKSGTMAMTSDITGAAATISTPSDPSGTTSITGVHMGLAGAITPTKSGTIMVTIDGGCTNSVSADGCKIVVRYGSGTAPTNGASATGTAVGSELVAVLFPTPSYYTPFSKTVVITGLSLSTAYWLDITLGAIVTGTASVRDVTISAIEV